MNNREIKGQIINLLRTLPVCTANSMETQWAVRCPYCGDSKNESHGHLSIHIDKSSDDAMMWRCFKCDASGIVNEDLLRDLGLYVDTEMRSVLKESTKRAAKFNKFQNDYIERLEIPAYTSYIAKRNLQYINNRLGANFTLNDALAYNMILDLQEFMRANNLQSIPGVSKGMLWFISQNYVGFLTANKNTIVMRLVTEVKTAKRYLKYKINPLNQNPAGFFNIPGQTDLMGTEPLHVHVAEGIFDILNVERYVKSTGNSGNSLFFASCGFGPMTVVQYLVYMGLGGNIRLHVYCDNDKSDYEEIKVLKRREEMLPWCSQIFFHRNQYPGEKDYGVPLNRVQDGWREVKI